MKVNDWLKAATARLTDASIHTARLDALVLLEDATGKDRAWLLANPEHLLPAKTVRALNGYVERRARHEPLAYIRGKSEFFGREFTVTPATLQPRPETETMINSLLALKLPPGTVIADIGTGSGAIAITAKLELPAADVHAVEINDDVLKVARHNADKLQADIQFYQGNLLQPLLDNGVSPAVVLANLPYVPSSHTVNQAAMQEPAIAIFGGEDGLDLYRELFGQMRMLPKKPTFVLTESLPFQHKHLSAIANTAGYQQVSAEDFIQHFSLT